MSAGAIRRLLSTVGSTRVLALVTPRNHASSGQAMRAAARRHPDRVLLIDWRRYSSGRRGVFGGDGLHPTPTGTRVFAAYIARRAAPVIKPPSRSLHLPVHRTGTKDCGTQRRFGRTLAVRVVTGRGRIACARARQIARLPPLQGIPGWAWADWTPLPGPWIDAYRRRDRRVVVATAPVTRG